MRKRTWDQSPLKGGRPGRYPPSRSESRTCAEPDCIKTTREGKPYCPEHIIKMPRVQQLLLQMADREKEVEEAEKGLDQLKDHLEEHPDSLLIKELLLRLRTQGPQTIDSLPKSLQISSTAVNSYVLLLLENKIIIDLPGRRTGTTFIKIKEHRRYNPRNLLSLKKELIMFSYRRNPCTCSSCPEHGTASRRLRRYRRNPYGYRHNLLPLARREELQDLSPGNFRRPTLAVTKDYLDDWTTHGVSSSGDLSLWRFDDLAAEHGTTTHLERAKELNRFDEASHYMDQYSSELDLWTNDPSSYDKPKFTEPVGGKEFAEDDLRDYGDYEPSSDKQAYNYLYQFLHRNAEKRADGEKISDVRQAPYKWRYREAVLDVGSEKATKLVKRCFATFGLRAPKWYLPENLYDDIETLFPAPASSRHRRRSNPWTR